MAQDSAEPDAGEFLREILELNEKGETDEEPKPDGELSEDSRDTTLEILRVLREGSIKRWENRRDQEWKLNYAFWVALIGLIVLCVSKDAHLTRPAISYIVMVLSAGFIVQISYLWFITSRAIAEIDHQFDTERALRSLLPVTLQKIVREEKLAAGMAGRQAFDRHYGIFAPLGISLLLCVTAGWLMAHLPDSKAEPKVTNEQKANGAVSDSNEPASTAVIPAQKTMTIRTQSH